MNKGYIKRQLNLQKIGVNISEDVETYDILFKEYTNIGDFIEISNVNLLPGFKMWLNKYKQTTYYDTKEYSMHIEADVYHKLHWKYKISRKKTTETLKGLYEYYLNIEIRKLNVY